MAKAKAILYGGKDSAEKKLTKCQVFREGRTPHHEVMAGSIPIKQKSPQMRTFIGGGKGNCLGFALRSESFAIEPLVQVCSISSLSGLTSCRPSANPLNPQKVIPVQPLNYKAD